MEAGIKDFLPWRGMRWAPWPIREGILQGMANSLTHWQFACRLNRPWFDIETRAEVEPDTRW